MTIITIDNVALAETLEPWVGLFISVIVGVLIYMSIKLSVSVVQDSKNRERLKECKQLYTARKRQFEDNPQGWKKWRDANYKITDLVESDTYY